MMTTKRLMLAATVAGVSALGSLSANAFWGWNPFNWDNGPWGGGPWGGGPWYGAPYGYPYGGYGYPYGGYGVPYGWGAPVHGYYPSPDIS
ncbi:sulfur globule protein CV3 [Thiocystis minor]|uniref:sulfur globule protein CV3 n=1 Tax=Thiocystis minor TaxID=61597 RepID=UPI0023EE35B5|nr:sulfur globule protein CV3 [Thiocystis minor]MBK5966917.1 sulfur globule protein CV3 [Thiocystis minor]